jgi:hypothetical protein
MNKKIYRKYYKIKCLLKLLDDINLNYNLRWISFDEIKNYLNLIINQDFENSNMNYIKNAISYILEEKENIESSDEDNKKDNIESPDEDNKQENVKYSAENN